MEKLALASDPVQLFYHGQMADIIVNEIQKNGKFLEKVGGGHQKKCLFKLKF